MRLTEQLTALVESMHDSLGTYPTRLWLQREVFDRVIAEQPPAPRMPGAPPPLGEMIVYYAADRIVPIYERDQ